MESLVTVTNKVQDLLLKLKVDDLKPPQIVFLGEPSSGKNSVVESLVGHKFIPNEADCVLKFPVILELINCPLHDPCRTKQETQIGDWAILLHDPSKIFTSYEDIRKELERQDKLGKDINQPVIIKIFSEKVMNLVVVTLPEIWEDNPPTQNSDFKDHFTDYIKNPNALIVPAVSSNQHISTNICMELARLFDPNGERTLILITKLPENEENFMGILRENLKFTNLGVLGILNKEQEAVNERITNVISYETYYVRNNFPTLILQPGPSLIADFLQFYLIKNVEKSLPGMKETVNRMLVFYKDLMRVYMSEPIDDSQDRLFVALERFVVFFRMALQERRCVGKELPWLRYKARFWFVFREEFWKLLDNLDPLLDLTRLDIADQWNELLGEKLSIGNLYLTCCAKLIQKHVAKLKKPSLFCVYRIYSELRKVISTCPPEYDVRMALFPNLYNTARQVANKLLKKRWKETRNVIHKYFEGVTQVVNFRHPDLTEEIERFRPMFYPKNEMSSCSASLTKDFDMFSDCSPNSVLESKKNPQFEEPHPLSHYQEPGEFSVYCSKIQTLFAASISLKKEAVKYYVPNLISRYMIDNMAENLLPFLKTELLKSDESYLLKEPSQKNELKSEISYIIKSLTEAKNELQKV